MARWTGCSMTCEHGVTGPGNCHSLGRMAHTLTATTASELRHIDGALHDQCFVLPDLAYEPEKRTLAIPFLVEDASREAVLRRSRRGRPKLVSIPLCQATLRIGHTTRYTVEDNSQIEVYTAVNITVASDPARVNVEAAENCQIDVDIQSLDVELEVTDEIVARVTRRLFLLGGQLDKGPTHGPWPFD